MDEAIHQIRKTNKRNMKKDRGEIKRSERESTLLDISDLGRNALKSINATLSACEASANLNLSQKVSTLLDKFLSAVQNEKNEIAWNNFGSEIGNIALRILSAIERTENFQIYFSKLISSMCTICTWSAGTWRQFIRPLLNVFTNKKLNYIYLKQSIKEFKSLLKFAEREEMTKFTEQNLHLLQGFSMIAFHVGDFSLQMDVLEIVFVYTSHNRKLAQAILAFANASTRQLIETLDFSDFQKDSRILLNEMNSGFGSQKRIFSINCNLVYFGSAPISPPVGMDGIWMDVNRDSRIITIFCSNFLPNGSSVESIILQLPLSGIEKLKIEFGSLSGGDCYCITMRTSSLNDIYEFASGNLVVCTALISKNSREAMEDFVKVMEELSPEIRELSQTEGTDLFESQNKTGSRKGKPRASCTSPAVFATGRIDKNGRNGEQKKNQMSSTSPLTLPTYSREGSKTFQDQKRHEKNDGIGFSSLQQEDRVHTQKFCNLLLETSSSCQSKSGNARSLRNDVFQGNISLRQFGIRRHTLSNSEQKEENKENKRERGDYARQVCEDWESSCEDFIPTQEFKFIENNKENIAGPISPITHLQKESRVVKGKRTVWRQKKECLSMEKTVNTSLLDPNGYAYKRWLRPTTSDRSNFWLKKIQDLEKMTVKPEADVFNFTDEEFSEDFNVFRKEKSTKRKKLIQSTEKECRKLVKTSENRKKEPLKEDKGKPKLILKANIKPIEKLKSKESETRATVKSESRTGTYRRDKLDVLVPEGRYPMLELSGDIAEFQVNGKSKNERESVRRGRQKEQEGRSGIKRNLLWNNDNSSIPALIPVRNRREITEDLEELNDIARKLSSGFEEWMQDMIDCEVNETRKHAKELMTRLNNLAEEEKREMESISSRFELCIQYFIQGCSIADSENILQMETEKIAETVKELTGIGKRFGEKTKVLAGRFKETIAAEVKNRIDKDIKLIRIQQMEKLISRQASPQCKNIFSFSK